MTITKSYVTALASVVVMTGAAASQDFTIPDDAPLAIPGEYLVTVEEDADAQAIANALSAPSTLELGAQTSVETVTNVPLTDVVLVEIAGPEAALTQGTEDIIASLQQLDGVVAVQPNYAYYAIAEPDDPRYGAQYMFDRINAEQAWDMITSSPNTVIGIVDTGIDYRHPDLAANMWTNSGEIPNNNVDDDNNGFVDDVHGVNVVNPGSPTGDPMDGNRHGTHVAGISAAVTDNALDVAGVTWEAQMMAVKFLSDAGSGSTAGAIAAINYAVQNGADILNNSWGGGAFDPLLQQAIQNAANAGILFVAAAGNAGRDNDQGAFYPCNYNVDNVLCVMATDRNDAKPSWSNFGQTNVDIAAPGVDILSTLPGGNVGSLSGTSMASPVVAGAAALLHGQDEAREDGNLKSLIMDHARQVAGLANQNAVGGILDLAVSIDPGDACEAPAQLAYDEIFWSQRRTFSSNSNVLSVDFRLDEPTAVLIHAQGSADRQTGNNPMVFRTGVYNGASSNVMWTGSYRRGTLTDPQQPTDVSSQFAITLPAGQHTMYWKLWLSGMTMEFDSASLSVLAVPCDMGGKLAGAAMMADKAPITQAN